MRKEERSGGGGRWQEAQPPQDCLKVLIREQPASWTYTALQYQPLQPGMGNNPEGFLGN